MSALQHDELQFHVTDQWDLPIDKEGFLAWLDRADVTFEEFQTFPAWRNAPAELRAALLTTEKLAKPERASAPPPPLSAKDSTVRAPGSDT